MSSKKFSKKLLLAKMESFPESERYWIAFSGGMDSHVLLYAIHEIRNELTAEIRAIHIDHGINRNSDNWVKHCQGICSDLEIELVINRINEECPKGESVESWARNQRYTLIQHSMKEGDILITAQHRDDQAETLLVQLLRGAGPMGLSAMPEIRKFGPYWQARPFLDFTREQLHDYAIQNRLTWIDDDSNVNQEFDRNFIRHTILPALRKRWPNISGVLSRVAAHQAESTSLLEEIAKTDLKDCVLSSPYMLSVNKFDHLSKERIKNLIRFWLKGLDIPLPDSRILEQIVTNVISSSYDANPCVTWQGMELRRYRNVLYAGKESVSSVGSNFEKWDMNRSFVTPLGELSAVKNRGRGISAASVPDSQLHVRYRRGGETIQPFGRSFHKTLKKLFQEYHIPPWFRDQIPLLYLDNNLVAVAGFWVEDRYHATAEEESWEIKWEGVDKVVFKD